MSYVKHSPSLHLRPFVHSMWFRDAGEHEVTGVRMLPSGRTELVFTLDGSAQTCWSSANADGPGQTLGFAVLQLQRSGHFSAAMSGRCAAFGVSFRPMGLRRFLRTPISEFSQPSLSLSEVWGAHAADLTERLAQAPTNPARFKLMESVLWQRLHDPERLHDHIAHAVCLLSDPFTVRRIADLASALGLRERQFLQAFREETGMTPKAFARVMRLNGALQLLRRKVHARGTDVAAMCNYFDQAHLVREFRELTGMTPTAYLAEPCSHVACLPWSRSTPRDSAAARTADPLPALATG